MKRYMILFFAVLMLGAFSCAGPKERKPESLETDTQIDAATLEVLQKINSVSAYEVPDLGLREDENYAKTTRDVEPFRHVEPYKEYFLLQIEYTGPGRAIPEPNDIETVKLGFIGPIMS
ncbi:MAG TPA: hypothetical protein VMX36_01980, partial [Sedimentisphaerales bacterium]|nr:hypothetical protein [Sedimentisphaerales bacterium]